MLNTKDWNHSPLLRLLWRKRREVINLLLKRHVQIRHLEAHSLVGRKDERTTLRTKLQFLVQRSEPRLKISTLPNLRQCVILKTRLLHIRVGLP